MKKSTLLIILIISAFTLFLAGIFIGRISRDGSIGVYTQKSVRNEHIEADDDRLPIVININTATAEELQDLPGIGPKTAEAIIVYREENGPFKYKIDLLKVEGIGEKTYKELSSLITVADTK